MKDSYNVSYVKNGLDDGENSKEKPDANSSVTLKKVVSIDENSKDPNDTKKVIVTMGDQDSDRPQWDNQIEFILSAVGYAVGLGNVWRFPYLVYKNGGGTFLIPYVLMLIFTGLPLFFMELTLGQYTGQGPTRVFGRLAPALKGLGFAMLAVTCYVNIYYNVILAWTLFYMFSGMQSVLPWTTCSNSSTHCHNGNITYDLFEKDHYVVSPAEDYFTNEMLGLDKDIHNWEDFGEFRWQLVLCLLGAWIIVCLCLIKGVQSAGKVVYFTGKQFFTFCRNRLNSSSLTC